MHVVCTSGCREQEEGEEENLNRPCFGRQLWTVWSIFDVCFLSFVALEFSTFHSRANLVQSALTLPVVTVGCSMRYRTPAGRNLNISYTCASSGNCLAYSLWQLVVPHVTSTLHVCGLVFGQRLEEAPLWSSPALWRHNSVFLCTLPHTSQPAQPAQVSSS